MDGASGYTTGAGGYTKTRPKGLLDPKVRDEWYNFLRSWCFASDFGISSYYAILVEYETSWWNFLMISSCWGVLMTNRLTN